MIKGLFIKPEQHADSLVDFWVTARLQSSLAPPPPSIPANRCASLWHTDIIAARQNKPKLHPPKEVRRAAWTRAGGSQAAPELRAQTRRSLRAPCHRDCKHGLQNGATAVCDRLPHASPRHAGRTFMKETAADALRNSALISRGYYK